MCGIFFCASSRSVAQKPGFQAVAALLKATNALRGPDAQESLRVQVDRDGDGDLDAGISMEFFASELHLRGSSVVVQPHRTGGDILCWNGEIFDGLPIDAHENDGVKMFSSLRACRDENAVRKLLGSVEGPYAFIYYQATEGKVYFARDSLGRRSLLVHKPTSDMPYMILASTSIGAHPGYSFEEVSAECVYCLDVQRAGTQLGDNYSSCLNIYQRRRDQPDVPFDMPRIVNGCGPPSDLQVPASLDAIPNYLSSAVDDILAQVGQSVMLRVKDIPRHSSSPGEARVAVLFSGGIDCTMLAYLAHQHVAISEPIDLLNVAFENPRRLKAAGLGTGPQGRQGPEINDVYLVPDRVAGLTEVEELRRVCPGRQWNFVEIDVPFEEMQSTRATVEALMWPSNTVMDLSLASALYFAARGIGQVADELYTSPARVLLSGLGADELLGGYGRHRTAFEHGGWSRLVNELQLEIDRIPVRNLGRDDRVISAHGKETRHPFLSLSVVNFLAGLPVHLKTDPRGPPGVGDKMLLRMAARKVGLAEASGRKKKAMQFGSASAKMEGIKGERKGAFLLSPVNFA